MPVTATPEQQAVIDSASNLLIVKALAGTGKTTTLVGYAKARPDARILYLAYNKAMEVAASGKFGRNVTCKTVHALAYGKVGRRFQDAGKLGNVRTSDVMMSLDYDAHLAKHALETVNNFIYSADLKFTVDHVSESVSDARRALIFDKARVVWKAMMNLESGGGAPRLPMSHDGYLKLFQLNSSDLAKQYDIILLDEAQDSNPVTAAVVLGQACTRVLVGDSHQSIYGFRKSTNALEHAGELPGAEVKMLTHSFRFGPDVAAMATAVLAGVKGETVALVGAGPQAPLRTRVDRRQPHAVLCRTNATVFQRAAELLGKQPFHMIGGPDSYPLERLLDVHRLAQRQLDRVRDPFFKKQGSLARLQEYADSIKDVEILGLLGMHKEHGNAIPGLVERIRREHVPAEQATVHLATAHRTKGLEFDQVILENDFAPLDDEGCLILPTTQEEVEEVNLLYVALTRAVQALEINDALRCGLLALGRDGGFELPEGTQDSRVVARMMGRSRLPIRGAQPVESLDSGLDEHDIDPVDDADLQSSLAGIAPGRISRQRRVA